jgi:hypothetical protein
MTSTSTELKKKLEENCEGWTSSTYILLTEVEERKARALASKHIYSHEDESKMGTDGTTLPDDQYPSDDNSEREWCKWEAEGESGMEAGMEELLVQGESVVQGVQCLDQQTLKTEQNSRSRRSEGSRQFLGSTSRMTSTWRSS